MPTVTWMKPAHCSAAGGEGKKVLDTKFSHFKGSLSMGVAAGNDATNADEVCGLMEGTCRVNGATFVHLEPDRAEQPKVKTASGFIAGRCTYLSTKFQYEVGTDKTRAITLTMFENAGIGEGRKITYEQLVGSLDKDGGLRRLLAEGFSSTERVAQDAHVYATVTAAYPSMVANFASPLAPESELYRLRSVLKPDVKRKPVRRNKPQGPATGRVAPRPEDSKAFYCTKLNCRKRFAKEAGMAAHIAKCAGGRADVLRVKTGTEATDAAEGMMNQQCATMPTNRTERQPSPNTLPPMGFGRNQGRGAAHHFSEAELEQLVFWYHEGAERKEKKKKGKQAAADLISMKLHDPGDEDPSQFAGNYAKRISAWFGSYHRAMTKRLEQVKRAGRVEDASMGLLINADMAKKKPKGPPKKRRKTVASVQAPGPIVTSVPNEKPKEKKKKRQPGALGSAVPGAPELPSAALPIPAPTTDVIVGNRIMASTQAPRKVPKSRRTAKGKTGAVAGAASSSAAGATVPPSVGLGVADDVTAVPSSGAAVLTVRMQRESQRPTAGQHRNAARLPSSATAAASAKKRKQMPAYDEFLALQAAAQRDASKKARLPDGQ